ncbi:MAG: hypothetical protein ACQETQ_11455 [Spirochaetota bacterium]
MGDAMMSGAGMHNAPSDEDGQFSVVVAETEPFFTDLMKVYVDLLCRGDREGSRAMFRSGVRFAGAVKGMSRSNAGAATNARTALAAKQHLERCLFALYSVQQRTRPNLPPPRSGETAIESRVFERGLALLSALRSVTAHQEHVSPSPP